MKCLTIARGDGKWGQLHGAYYLAEGDPAALSAVFTSLEKQYGKPTFGGKGTNLAPIPDQPLPTALLADLKKLPRAAKTKPNPDT